MSKVIGIAGRQGNCQEHQNILDSLGFKNKIIVDRKDIKGLTHLILPGGESTTQEMLWRQTGLWEEIKKFDNPVLGTCAGAIHIAKMKKKSITCTRNAFGNQKESFYKEMDFHFENQKKTLKAMFIRAPKINISDTKKVKILASFTKKENDKKHTAVIRLDERYWLSSCHPEAVGDSTLHEVFLKS